jgi:hypothetical protein
MTNNEHISDCSFAIEIVPYLYGELATPQAASFEDHLVECGSCRDEFAAIADTRYSVYEWQTGEFAQLATPRIVVPFADAPSAGWIDSIRAMFTAPAFAASFAALMVLLLCVGAGYVYFRPYAEQAVVVEQPAIPTKSVADTLDDDINVEPPRDVLNDPAPKAVEPVTVKAVKQMTRPVRAVANRRPSLVSNAPSSVPVAKKPVLSNFDEDEDGSLRLSDLLGDDGGV